MEFSHGHKSCVHKTKLWDCIFLCREHQDNQSQMWISNHLQGCDTHSVPFGSMCGFTKSKLNANAWVEESMGLILLGSKSLCNQ